MTGLEAAYFSNSSTMQTSSEATTYSTRSVITALPVWAVTTSTSYDAQPSDAALESSAAIAAASNVVQPQEHQTITISLSPIVYSTSSVLPTATTIQNIPISSIRPSSIIQDSLMGTPTPVILPQMVATHLAQSNLLSSNTPVGGLTTLVAAMPDGTSTTKIYSYSQVYSPTVITLSQPTTLTVAVDGNGDVSTITGDTNDLVTVYVAGMSSREVVYYTTTLCNACTTSATIQTAMSTNAAGVFTGAATKEGVGRAAKLLVLAAGLYTLA